MVPSGESRVTSSKSLGSIRIACICSVSSNERSGETGATTSVGVNARFSDPSAMVCACCTTCARAAVVARTAIQNEPTIPMINRAAMTTSTVLAILEYPLSEAIMAPSPSHP